MGIHDYKLNKTLPSMEEKIKNAEYLEANKDAILNFENFLYATGTGPLRILAIISKLHHFAKDAKKEFAAMDKNNVLEIAARIEKSGMAESTKQQHRTILKQFFRWLQGEQNAAS